MLQSKNIKLNKKIWITILLVCTIIIWRIPFLNKGIDYTDTGFTLCNYHDAFIGSGLHGIGLFMTNLIGGLIYKTVPNCQLLIFRILHWLFVLSNLFIAYKIIRPYLPRNLLLLLLLILSLSSKNGEALLNYYAITTFLLLLSIYLLKKGLFEQKYVLLFLSGIVAGINVFVRLPNVLFLCICLSIFVYGRLKKYTQITIYRSFTSFIIGSLIGISFDLFLMTILLTPSGMVKSLISYVNLALGRINEPYKNILGIEEPADPHSILILIRLIIIQLIRVTLFSVTYIFPPVLFVSIYQKFHTTPKNHSLDYSQVLPWGITILFCIWYFFLWGRLLQQNILYLLYIYSLIVCCLSLFLSWKANPEYSFLYFIAIILAPCTILGSDLGLTRLGIMQFYFIPLILIPLVKWSKMIESNSKIPIIYLKQIHGLQMICFFVIMIGILYCNLSKLPNTYMDASFNQLNFPVHDKNEIFKGMRTSETRVQQLEEYQNVMGSEKLEGKQVAIFGYFPLGHILGKQTNYFSTPCVDYPSVKIKSLLKQIDNHHQNGDDYPIIVVSYVNQLQRNDNHYTSPAKMAIIQHMLSLSEYMIIHQSRNFTIYSPVSIQ